MKQLQLTACLIFGHCVVGFCDDEQDRAKVKADVRLEFMRGVIAEIKVKPADADSEWKTKFHETPLLRFGDLARDTADGSLWKIGKGRPQVIVGLEFQRLRGKPHLGWEFLCLTDKRFEMVAGDGWKWTPAKSALEFQRLKNEMPPHKSAEVRLRQMKQFARRFSAKEMRAGDVYALRLMPQPIDQYVIDESDENWKGAIFVLAHGTNPEVLLLIEPLDNGWQYGLCRLAGAELTVKLDDQVVWTKQPLFKIGPSWQLDYMSAVHPLELPQPKSNE